MLQRKKEHQQFSFYENLHKEKLIVRSGKKIGKLLLSASQLMGIFLVGFIVVGVTVTLIKEERRTDRTEVIAQYNKMKEQNFKKMENITNEFNSQLYHLKNKDAILKLVKTDTNISIDIITDSTILFSYIQQEEYISSRNYYVIEFKGNKVKTIYIRDPDDSKINYLKNNNIPFTILKKEKKDFFDTGDLIKIEIK